LETRELGQQGMGHGHGRRNVRQHPLNSS
jgi:hypothetical protein